MRTYRQMQEPGAAISSLSMSFQGAAWRAFYDYAEQVAACEVRTGVFNDECPIRDLMGGFLAYDGC